MSSISQPFHCDPTNLFVLMSLANYYKIITFDKPIKYILFNHIIYEIMKSRNPIFDHMQLFFNVHIRYPCVRDSENKQNN